MFKNILVPLDGSEYGDRAIGYARELASIAGATVHLISVVQGADSPPNADSVAPDDNLGKGWLAYLEERAAELREGGVADVDTAVRFGDPARLIAETARSLQADLVIMSTSGRGADGRFGLGGVAQKVLMTASCPVFMIRINPPEPPRTPAEERWQSEGGANTG